jgi:hypothetical protein
MAFESGYHLTDEDLIRSAVQCVGNDLFQIDGNLDEMRLPTILASPERHATSHSNTCRTCWLVRVRFLSPKLALWPDTHAAFIGHLLAESVGQVRLPDDDPRSMDPEWPLASLLSVARNDPIEVGMVLPCFVHSSESMRHHGMLCLRTRLEEALFDALLLFESPAEVRPGVELWRAISCDPFSLGSEIELQARIGDICTAEAVDVSGTDRPSAARGLR